MEFIPHHKPTFIFCQLRTISQHKIVLELMSQTPSLNKTDSFVMY